MSDFDYQDYDDQELDQIIAKMNNVIFCDLIIEEDPWVDHGGES